jgi:hypothetical protein
MTKLETRNTKLETVPVTAVASVRDLKDLDAWKLARALRAVIYVLLRKLPVEERLLLTASSGVLLTVDACFVSKAEYDGAEAPAQRVIQTLNGYIRSTAKRQAESRKPR